MKRKDSTVEKGECAWCGGEVEKLYRNNRGEIFCSANHRTASNRALRRLMRRVLLLLVLAGCNSPTAPSDVPSTWVETVEFEWAAAIDELVSAGVPGWKAASIKWHDFTWREHPGPFTCGDIEDRFGCYTAGWNMIEWSALHPTVLRHEIKHGILNKLRYGCWRCVDHGCVDGPDTCPSQGEDNGS